jgi:hypothetical protein
MAPAISVRLVVGRLPASSRASGTASNAGRTRIDHSAAGLSLENAVNRHPSFVDRGPFIVMCSW